MREYSTPAVTDVFPSARLTDTIFDRAASDPGLVIIRRKAVPQPRGGPAAGDPAASPWQGVTALGFANEVLALAKGFIAAGISPGDRVALMSRTRYEWTLVDYAIWAAGAVSVPVYETSSAEQVEWILTDSGAQALVVETSAHLRTVSEVLSRLPDVSRVWLIEGQVPELRGSEPGQGPAVQLLGALAAQGANISDEQAEQRRNERTGADLATIIYTSGTTGRPKGCMITHSNLLASVSNATHGPLAEMFEVPDASTLLFLPLAHVFARIIEVGCLEVGIVLGHTADASGLVRDLASFRPTFLLGVPRVFEKVYSGAEQRAAASALRRVIFSRAAQTAIAWSEAFGAGGTDGPGGPGPWLRMRRSLFDHLVYSKLRDAVGGRVSYAVSGGAPLGDRLGHFFRGAGITIIEGYGLTESTAPCTANYPARIKIGTVGQPLPGVCVRIADDGEVLISGPNVFAGYWRNESATAGALTDGWLRSGDIGELDDDGYLRVTGRKKELIVTAGGKNVAPAVLEDRIRAHPLVSQCLVVGDTRPYIACLITLDEEALSGWRARHSHPAGATAAGLRHDPALIAEIQSAVDEANKTVSRAEQIKRFRILPADFTEGEYLTPSLKIRRTAVIKDFSREIEALYA